jgi:hypothetical protein
MIELGVRKEGDSKIIAFVIENKRNKCLKYLNSLTKPKRSRMNAIMGTMADEGLIKNQEIFKHLEGKIYEFKTGTARIFCFFHGNYVVCTHGAKKPSSKKGYRKHIEKADKIRERLIQQERRQS